MSVWVTLLVEKQYYATQFTRITFASPHLMHQRMGATLFVFLHTLRPDCCLGGKTVSSFLSGFSANELSGR